MTEQTSFLRRCNVIFAWCKAAYHSSIYFHSDCPHPRSARDKRKGGDVYRDARFNENITYPSVHKLLLISIQSRYHDFSLRSVIREGLRRLPYFDPGKDEVAYAFWVASPPPNDTETRDRILEEAATCGDVHFIEDIVDGWYEVGRKHDRFLRWGYPQGYKFMMKFDDDAYCYFKYLVNYLRNLVMLGKDQQYYFVGNHLRDALVDRKPQSKYYISQKEFPRPKYPVFALGYGSICTTCLVKMLIEEGYANHTLFMEDVMVGVWIEDYMKTKPSPAKVVHYVDLPFWGVQLYGGYSYLLTVGEKPHRGFYNLVHKTHPHQLKCLYEIDGLEQPNYLKHICMNRHE